jgi:phosphate acyltransferase
LIKIALDAMGGDHAPASIVKGAVKAVKAFPIEILLVGDEELIRQELAQYNNVSNISIQHASQVIGNNESPTAALKQKKDSSITVAISLLKQKKVNAVVSAGNTGALMAASLFGLGRIKGVERPAIATIFPTEDHKVLLLDMGANVDCKPSHLLHFGIMGSVYAEKVMHIKNPRIGLLNIGEEPNKGNELTIATYSLLKSAPINFVGNVESKEILAGKVDVIVCDGFIGNLVLKFAESVSQMVVKLLKKEIKKNPMTQLGALMLTPALMGLKKMVDYDEYGGAPLLGVNGICYKAHGRAKSKAIMNALREAAEAVSEKVIDSIQQVEEKIQ